MNEKIKVTKDYDHFSNQNLGNLTDKQYKSLEDVIRLSPGYCFNVIRYAVEGTTNPTHIQVYENDFDSECVGLVGKEDFQFYNKKLETYKTCLRVAHRVYHKVFNIEPEIFSTLL